MKTNLDYVFGLLNLVYVLTKSDEDFSDSERAYLERIRDSEGINRHDFDSFMEKAMASTERDCYEAGIQHISMCNRDEQMKAFVWMQQMAYADGRVSAKEVRLLLYAVKRTDISIDDVMEKTEKLIAA